MNINEVVITVDGLEIKQKENLFPALQNIQSMTTPRGGGFDFVNCEISCGEENLNLIIGRYGRIANAYVVYYPKYHRTEKNMIGGFYSDSIDLHNLK